MKYDIRAINKARKLKGAKPLPITTGLGRPAGPRPSRAKLQLLYVSKGLSIRATAERLGMTRDIITAALAEYRIKSHARVRPSKLAVYTTRELKARVKAEGLRATARALDVSAPTLAEYLERHGHRK